MTATIPMTTQIEQAVENIPGWSPLDQLLTLFTLAYSSANLPGDILELAAGDLVAADGTVAVSGSDFVQFDDEGKLLRIIGFFGPLEARP